MGRQIPCLAVILIFASLCAWWAAPAFSAPQRRGRGVIHGVVSDAQGQPAEGAVVQLQEQSGIRPRARRADAQGRFRFEDLRPGLYQLRASRDARSTEWVRNLTIRGNETLQVKVSLPPPPEESVPAPPKKQ